VERYWILDAGYWKKAIKTRLIQESSSIQDRFLVLSSIKDQESNIGSFDSIFKTVMACDLFFVKSWFFFWALPKPEIMLIKNQGSRIRGFQGSSG